MFGWSDDCTVARKLRDKARRRLKAATTTAEKDAQRTEWSLQDQHLATAIKANCEEEWSKFCENIDAYTTPAEMWRGLRRAAKSGKGQRGAATPMMRNPSGAPVSTPRQQAQLLTDHWAKRSSTTHPSNRAFSLKERLRIEEEHEAIVQRTKEDPKSPQQEPSYCRVFERHELDACISSLPAGKAAGWDGIAYEIIAALGPGMRGRLLLAINGLWMEGGVPADWKEAILIGLPKQETPTKEEDFRPISLLISLCKITEKLVKGRLWTEGQRFYHRATWASESTPMPSSKSFEPPRPLTKLGAEVTT